MHWIAARIFAFTLFFLPPNVEVCGAPTGALEEARRLQARPAPLPG